MLGRDVCGDWTAAIAHEWLVTNGLGGYACGTVAGANTRRYHGFLMASFAPPVDRHLLVAKVDVTVDYRGRRFALAANEFADGTVDPRGFVHLESFAVVGGVPVWRYALADALLQQSLFMARGANTSYLRLEVLRAGAPLRIEVRPLVTYREFHAHSRGARPFRADIAPAAAMAPTPPGCTIHAGGDARSFRLSATSGSFAAAADWYWNFLHREEAARGLDALEDLWGPGIFGAKLAPGQPWFFAATAEEGDVAPGAEVLAAVVGQAQRLSAALPKGAPVWVQHLAIASDQFIVRRGDATGAGAGAVAGAGASVIAGYPWFSDWGRDTMIALPGLTTVLGRHDAAAAILRTYAAAIDRGMLPNRFSDAGAVPEYNTADATLWMFHALAEHLEARRDPELLRDLFPTLMAVVHAHVDGTRYGIRVDADGLLRAGEPGTQLTWMDARHGDHAFTPRVGKPVEINALWLNALHVAADLAGKVRDAAEQRFCRGWLERATLNFPKFWNARQGALYDVIDVGVGGTDVDCTIRPNQILAVSLPHVALTEVQLRAVVDVCARDLVTSYGLRSLSPDDAAYVGRYEGGPAQRDAAYHQGTTWAWLLGPFARAHFRVYRDAPLARSFLAPIAQHLAAACVGSVSEIFDGEPPFAARGCFAQAWSVAEILRAWIFLERASAK